MTHRQISTFYFLTHYLPERSLFMDSGPDSLAGLTKITLYNGYLACFSKKWQHFFITHHLRNFSLWYVSIVFLQCYFSDCCWWTKNLISLRRVWLCASVRARYCDLFEIDHEDVVTERWETSHGHRCHQTVSFLCYRHYKEPIALEAHHVNKWPKGHQLIVTTLLKIDMRPYYVSFRSNFSLIELIMMYSRWLLSWWDL